MNNLRPSSSGLCPTLVQNEAASADNRCILACLHHLKGYGDVQATILQEWVKVCSCGQALAKGCSDAQAHTYPDHYQAAAAARLSSKKMAEQPQLSQIIVSTANTGVS